MQADDLRLAANRYRRYAHGEIGGVIAKTWADHRSARACAKSDLGDPSNLAEGCPSLSGWVRGCGESAYGAFMNGSSRT